MKNDRILAVTLVLSSILGPMPVGGLKNKLTAHDPKSRLKSNEPVVTQRGALQSAERVYDFGAAATV